MTPPPFIEIADFPGDAFSDKWESYVEDLYERFLRTMARSGITFRGLEVSCQFRPDSHGKHFSFWHIIQEGSWGRNEEERTPDMDRCRRIEWIAWVITNADTHPEIRVFQQSEGRGAISWALWLHEEEYVVILHERQGYYLLKTAFLANRRNTRAQLERDWRAWEAKRPKA